MTTLEMDGPGPIDPRRHRVLAGASRVRVLEFLRARSAPVAAAEVAERVGLHPNTVRLHLDQLCDAGLVTRANGPRTGPGRPRLLFAAAPVPPREPRSTDGEGYRLLAGILAGHLEDTVPQPAAEAVAAGRAWVRGRDRPATGTAPRPVAGPEAAGEATGRVLRLLDELGFAPSLPGPAGPIELHRCPFAQLAEQHSDVVCGVHLGLMQGALDELGAPVQTSRLEPFVEPSLCRAHLTPVPSRADSRSSGDEEGAAPPTGRRSRP